MTVTFSSVSLTTWIDFPATDSSGSVFGSSPLTGISLSASNGLMGGSPGEVKYPLMKFGSLVALSTVMLSLISLMNLPVLPSYLN